MATEAGAVLVRVSADMSDFKRGMSDASSSMDSLGNQASSKFGRVKGALSKMGTVATVALGGLAAGAFKSITAASDLSEQINKSKVVFATAADRVLAWSKTTAKSIGISRAEALTAAGTFGNMLKPMGFLPGKAATLSVKMVKLAADMASFNNTSPEEALEALRSGLAGETEPLRKFGVFLNEARVKQQALSMGLWDGEGALSASAKAAATAALMFKDTKDAQGDFARTSDSLANQQRILKAELSDTAAQLGKSLLPAATAVAGVLTDVANWTEKNSKATKILAGVVLGAAAAIKILNFALAANPLMLVVAGVAALTAALVIAYTKSETFRKIVKGAFDAVKTAVLTFADGVLTMVSGFLEGLRFMAEGASKLPFVGNKFKGVADAIGGAIDKVNELRDTIDRLKPKTIHIRAVVEGLGSVRALEEHLSLLNSRSVRAGTVPRLAHGGIVKRPTLAMIGERGPEAVIPLGRGGGAGFGGASITVNLPNYLGSKEEVARTIRAELVALSRRGGPLFSTAPGAVA